MAISQHARAVRLQGSDNEIIHHLDFFFAREAFLRLGDRRLDLWHAEPLLVLAKANFDVADALEILVELVGVRLREAALKIVRIGQHRIKHATLLHEHGLTFAQRCGVIREQPMKCLHRILQTRHRLPAHVPSHRQSWAVTRVRHVGRVELD